MYYIGLDVHKHSRRGADHGVDLGAGGGRRTALLLDQKGRQLLRIVRRREEFGEHRAAHAAAQATQQTFTDHADRSGKDGAAKQSGAGHAL